MANPYDTLCLWKIHLRVLPQVFLRSEKDLRQIDNRNALPNVNQIEVGEQLAIPQQPDTQHRGYWAWSSNVNSAPYDATFSVTFSEMLSV